MPDEPWFDEEAFAALRKTVNGTVFQRLLKLFVENTTSRLEEIMQLDPIGEPERLAVALHALKGSALMVGARELETTAEGLRSVARHREAADIEQQRKRLEAAVMRVHDRVRQELTVSD
ncbi:MAG: Hpt domain-containing protein [Acidobacteriota bacterium]|nr:Hpt domain-containing protein [Acidobacteriota bacterium]